MSFQAGRFMAGRERPAAILATAALLLWLAPLLPAARAPQLLPGGVRALGPGRLLIAARHLPDPNFSETVVLLADYDENGAMGLVVNRRSDVPLARAFPGIGPPLDPQHRLYIGGPVAPTGVLALLRSDTPPSGARAILDDVHLIGAREPLEDEIRARTAPARFRVYVGYAGWGPGQLERETADGSWHVVRATADVVFDPEPASVWERQIRLTEARMARLAR